MWLAAAIIFLTDSGVFAGATARLLLISLAERWLSE